MGPHWSHIITRKSHRVLPSSLFSSQAPGGRKAASHPDRAELQCPAMGDNNLDELADQGAGPDRHLRPSPASLASDTEGSSGGDSADEDGSGSEPRGSTDGEDEEEESADEDLRDRSASEDSEEEEEEEEDVETFPAVANTQKGMMEANGALDSDEEEESCPICLNVFRGQAVGTPESCAHYFCLDCIVEWSKNANSCPVDRTLFKCICIRARFGGKILRKIPVESPSTRQGEEEDPTFCEVCGRSDREDRLLLCDGCDAGYHMECLDPPLHEVPVDEWFCPECTAPVPTTSRLRPNTGRTRAIARTRQSERVRATVNRNRITTARRIQHVPRHLMSSLLDETIEAVASGLSTSVYQHPATPRAPGKRRRKAGRRRKGLGRKRTQSRSVKPPSSGTRSKKRPCRAKKRRGKKSKIKNEVTVRSRIAKTLGLRKPVHGASIPSVYKPVDPSLGLMRADIGAASLSLFGDPYELDPFDSCEELATNPASPASAKRRVLSQSALRSHQPVARPVSVGLPRRSVAAAVPGPEVEAAPVPDLLGHILSSQSLLLMSSADVVIHRDGSLSAKRAAPVSFQRNSFGPSGGDGGPGSGGCSQAGAVHSEGQHSPAWSTPSRPTPGTAPVPALSCVPVRTSGVARRPDSPPTPQPVQVQNVSHVRRLGLKRCAEPRSGDGQQALPPRPPSSQGCSSRSHSPAENPVPGQPLTPVPRRVSISELPRIPKIRRDSSGSGHLDSAPASGHSVEIPSSCISRLTGRGSPGQPGRGTRAEGKPGSRGPQEPGTPTAGSTQPPAPDSHGSLAPPAALRGKNVGSTFESFRINIPGNAAHSSRLSSPGFCNTFQPVDSKVQRKETPSPLFSIKKTKQLKSEIYDPFDPTGSDSSSPRSSPERPGPVPLPSEITRTISNRCPEAPALEAVRCVTSYTVGAAFGTGPEPPRGPCGTLHTLRDKRAAEGEECGGEALGEEPTGKRGLSVWGQRLSLLEPWEDEDGACRSSFFGSQERTVTCVTVVGPEAPPSPDTPLPATHRVVELRSPSRSRSRSHSRSEEKRKKATVKEKTQPGTRSRSRSGSRCRARSSRSASLSLGEDNAKKHRAKAKSQRSSSDGSSSHDRAKGRRPKEKGQERRHGPRGRRRSGSRSGSPSSSSHEHHEGRKKRRRRSGSRPRGREGSPPSSPGRVRRHGHRRDPRETRRSRDRGRRRSRSPGSDPRPHAHQRPHSWEKQPQTRSHSPGRKLPVKVASPSPPQQVPRPLAGPAAGPPTPVCTELSASLEVAMAHEAPPAVETLAEAMPDDLDYGDTVEAGHVFEDFSSEAVFMQLDDMSSPPSPESTDSSPERVLPPHPAPAPAGPQGGASLAVAVVTGCTSLAYGEGAMLPPPPAQGPPEWGCPQQASALHLMGGQALGAEEGGLLRERVGVAARPGEDVGHSSLPRPRAPVKRVTWNLQEEGGSAPPEDQAPRTPLHQLQRPQDGAWEVEVLGPVATSQALPSELPPPSHILPEPAFFEPSSSQVYSPNMPLAPALPSSVPPDAPVSQPTSQCVMQGSLPLVGCMAAPSLAPVPTVLTTALEPAVQAPMANDSEEKTVPKPAAEKTKNEEYMKKLHMQERAVEEVKLAMKPFYQRREVSKDEYKDILRKAVQKICHSRSGQINPVKVANLVRAYVEKYRHMRKHKRAEPEEQPPAQEAAS
ncbi:PHD and RING finger domain-containing protein 1 isoform X4 [Choloepus didactylus]|uniref:PHD and RING finger domain-containing protein 1 isoform X4 n=1 Tax=Choloepus didactylus TaxID=27675 RepID=UPI00189F1975|nr:PHD and RING finger domain-containing protein 1 isoform X4 [Choloepus didactylus]